MSKMLSNAVQSPNSFAKDFQFPDRKYRTAPSAEVVSVWPTTMKSFQRYNRANAESNVPRRPNHRTPISKHVECQQRPSKVKALRRAVDDYTTLLQLNAAPCQEMRPLLSPATLLDTALLDPFKSTVVPMDYSRSFLVNLFCAIIMPQQQMTQSFKARHDSYVLSSAMQHDITFHAILYRASVELSTGGTQFPKSVLDYQIRLDGGDPLSLVGHLDTFKGDLIRSWDRVRVKKQDTTIDSPTLTAIGIYLRAALTEGNVDTMLDIMSKLTDSWPHRLVINEHPPQVTIPVLNCIYQACVTLRCPAPTRPPEPPCTAFSRETASMLNGRGLPQDPLLSGFQEEAVLGELESGLASVLPSLRTIITFSSFCATSRLQPTPVDFAMIANLRQQILFDLVSLPADAVLSAAQESARLAILICLMMGYLSFSPQSYYTGAIAQQLHDAARRAVENQKESCSRLMVWVQYVGTVLSKRLKERSWFVWTLSRLCECNGIATENNLLALVDNFIHPSSPYIESVGDLWEEIQMLQEDSALGCTSMMQ